MMGDKVYDAIVVGGGPAGSTASYYLSKNKKLNILIIDKFDFPRNKSCGGLLNHLKAMNFFENYSNIKDKLKKQPIHTIKFYYDTKFAFSRSYHTLFNKVNRYEFDDLLFKESLKKSNVSFKKFNLKKIEENKKGFVLSDGKENIYGKYIIGADGWLSEVSQFLGDEKRNRNQYALCMEYEIICDKKDLATSIFYFYSKEVGYAWIIPSRKGYYIGLGMVGKTKKNTKSYLDDFLNHCVKNNLIPKKYDLKRTFGAPDPISISKKYATNKILLCGDALGTVKQSTGEGMYYAMLSGKAAGKLMADNFDNLEKRYKKEVKPIIKSVTSFKSLPPKFVLLWMFRLISGLLNSKKIPKWLRKKFENWFVCNMLEIE